MDKIFRPQEKKLSFLLKNNSRTIFIFLVLTTLTGCSPMLTYKESANQWIGHSVESLTRYEAKIQSDRNRSNKNFGEMKEEQVIILGTLEHFNSKGKCYTDFVVDKASNKIIGYKIHGDEGACSY